MFCVIGPEDQVPVSTQARRNTGAYALMTTRDHWYEDEFHDSAADAHEARQAASRAARRAGMTLAEWLEAVESGEPPHRARRPRRMPGQARSEDPMRVILSRLDAMEDGFAGGREASDEDVVQALSAITGCISQNERSTRQTLNSIEGRLERLISGVGANVEVHRDEASGALRSIAGKIQSLAERAGPTPDAGAGGAIHQETVKALEEKLRGLAERIEKINEAPSAQRPRINPCRNGNGLAAAVESRQEAVTARTEAAMQHVHQSNEAGLRAAIEELAARQEALENGMGRMAETSVENLNGFAERIENRVSEASSPDSMRNLEAEIRAVSARLGRDNAEDFEAMRADLSAVADRLDNATDAIPAKLDPHLRTISDRLGDLARSDVSDMIDDLGRKMEAYGEADLNALRAEIRNAAEELDSGADTRAERLSAQIGNLPQRDDFERLSKSVEGVPDLAGLKDSFGNIGTRDDIDTLRSDMAHLVNQGSQANRADFDNLREEISSLSTRADLEALRDQFSNVPTRADMQQLRDELSLVAGRIQEGPAATSDAFAPSIADISERIDAASGADLEVIRSEIRELGERFDNASRNEFESIRTELKDLGSKLSQMSAGGAGNIDDSSLALDPETQAELRTPREELRGLAASIEDSRRSEFDALRVELQGISSNFGGHAGDPGLQDNLAALTARIDSLPTRGSDPAMLASLETQIGRLAEAVDRNQPATAPALDGLEKSMADLFDRLEAGRAETVAAAREAVNAAVQEAISRLQDQSIGQDVVEALKAQLVGLQSSASQSGRETQDTLAAVHGTLEKIVSRLADLEDEVDVVSEVAHEPVRRQPATAASAPQAPAEPEAPAAEAAEATIDRNDDTPLEPGYGRPDEVTLAGSDVVIGNEPSGDRADFIAAARRAAQAVEEEEEEKAKSSKPGRLSGLKGKVKVGKRPLIAAVTALLVIAGAFQLYGKFVRKAANEPSVSTVETISPSVVGEDKVANPDAKPAEKLAAKPDTENPESLTTGSVPPKPCQVGQRQDKPRAAPSEPVESRDVAAVPAKPEKNPAAQLRRPMILPEDVGPLVLREAAIAGDPAAQFEVASRYTEGRGVAQNLAEAVKWYQLAAAQELAPAQYRLGSLFEKGHGVNKNLAKARIWYKRAAEQGNRKAMHNLAVLYAEGINGKPNYTKAAQWFTQAAEHGLRDSQYNLAILYARGLGLEQDFETSYKWFSIAARQGDREAGLKRDELAERLDKSLLPALNAAADTWQPKPRIEAANFVAAPEGGWGDEQPKVTILD